MMQRTPGARVAIVVLSVLVVGICYWVYLRIRPPAIGDLYSGVVSGSNRLNKYEARIPVADLRQSVGPIWGMAHGSDLVNVGQSAFVRVDTGNVVEEEPTEINGRKYTLLTRREEFQLPDVGSCYLYSTHHMFATRHVLVFRPDENQIRVVIK